MERLTNIGSNGEIWITDNDETRKSGRKETAYRKLAEYEDAEEKGLTLRLPCKVGDSVYSVIEDGLTIVELKFSLDFYERRKNDFGKTVFLTKEEAEDKFKRNINFFNEINVKVRNKAIDDFAKWLENKKYLMKEIQEHDFCYTHYDELKSNYVVAEYLEEQLKAGEDNV